MKKLLILTLLLLYIKHSNAERRFPIKNATFITNQLIFKSNNPINIEQCDSFLFQISNDSLFTNLLVNTTSNNDSLSINTLSFDETYFWKTIGFRIGGTDTSEVFKFKIINPEANNSIKLWLNPNLNTYTNLNGEIDSIKSISNNYIFSQNNSTNRPTLKENGLFNEIVFDGVDDFLINNSDSLNFYGKSWTIHIIMKKKDGLRGSLIDKRGLGNIYYTPGYVISLDSTFHNSIVSDGQLRYQRFSSQNYWNSDSTLIHYKIIWNNSTGKMQVWRNQSFLEISNGFGTQANSYNTSNVNLTIGGTINTTGNLVYNLNGSISELIMIDTINTNLDECINRYLDTKYTPVLDLDRRILMNNFCDTTFTLNSQYIKSFLWSNGDTSNQSTFSKSGTYWVKRTNLFNKIHCDTFEIIYPKVSFQVQNDTTICFNDSLILHIPSNNYSQYTWQDNSYDSIFRVNSSGIYYCEVSDSFNCLASSDTLNIIIDSFDIKDILPNNLNICKYSDYTLDININTLDSIFWSTGASSQTINIDTSGNFSVFLKNNNSCKLLDSMDVSIIGLAPQIDYSITNTCTEDSSIFKSLSSTVSPDNINKIEWFFSNNADTIISNEFKKSFFNPGNYQLFIKATTDSGCTNTRIDTFTIFQKPLINFNAPIICLNDSFILKNIYPSISDNIWLVNNDTLSYDTTATFYAYKDSLNSISLIATNQFGCTDSLTKSVEIFPELKANFDVSNNCIGDSTIFIDKTASFSVVAWKWNIGGFTSLLERPKMLFQNVGNIPVQLEVENAIGCKSTAQKNIYISPQPIANFNFDKACENDSTLFFDESMLQNDSITSFKWQIDTFSYTDDSATHYFSEQSIYLAKLQIETKKGCTDDTTRAITVHENPEPDFDFNPKYGTSPIEISMQNQSNGNNTYLWNFGDGQGTSTDENPKYTYTENGIYNISLTAINEFNCDASTEKELSIIPSELDIELKKLSFDIKENIDNTYKITPKVQLKNVGSRLITNADLVLNLKGQNKLAQKWENTLAIGSTADFTFDSYFIVNTTESAKYLCVEAINVNDGDEINLANNKVCKLLEGRIQFSEPYPNPAQSNVYLDIVSKSKGKCTLQIFSINGKEMSAEKEVALLEGFNKIQIDTKNYHTGKYYIKIKYLDDRFQKPFIIR